MARYLSGGGKQITLPLRLEGTVANPRPVLTAPAVEEQLKERLQEKAGEQLRRVVPSIPQ